MIIGTAGHVDHGKTSLVKALTGIDTDRLKEEKRRGITLELGFAHLALDDGTIAGVVDVPGHERFVKAMVAGAGGVDLALLVVAADEGVMPQTREHLDICRLLGVRAGVVALTKSDLLTELGAEWLELVTADLKTLTRGTFLEQAHVVPCSVRTGAGLTALKTALTTAAASVAARPSEGPLFLPSDRAFTIKGFGTVVTGTLLSGQLTLEDEVSFLPGLPGPFRVRGLQRHGKKVARALAGERVAVNVAGIEAEKVSRGLALTRVDELPQTRMLDVELELLSAVDQPLPRRSKLLLHLGTAQVEVTVALLEGSSLRPGESTVAQLRTASPVVALPDQRFILRGPRVLPGRGSTLAGGRVLTLTPPRRRKGSALALRPLLGAEPEARVPWLLRQVGYAGLTEAELFARAGLGPKPLQRVLELLSTRGAALLIDRERRLYLSTDVFEGMRLRALATLEAFHQREPMKEGLGLEELRRRLGLTSERTFARLLLALTTDKKVELLADKVRLPGRGRLLSLDEEATRAKAVAELGAAGLGPPAVNELALRLALPPARLLELLKVSLAQGAVVKVSDELYFESRALLGLKAKLVAHLEAHQALTTPEFKELVGQSRKYVIPLAEYFDREKVTLRVGEKRQLRRGGG